MNILTIKWRHTLRAVGAQLLALSFVTAIASPAFAVVFTNPASITVNDATTIGTGNPYPSNIAVSGLTGTVTNVTVTLNNLTSTFPDDTDVLLVAPNGNNLILMSDTGGSDDITNTTITFDDAAATTLPDATKLLTGVF
jgi:subtilisin-like proprotein convertase family protein